MLIENIKAHEILSQFLEDDCCENNICVTFAENIVRENYIIIKVDKYYNSLGLAKTPASLDCLIIRKCLNTGFGLTLVELKDIHSGKAFEFDNMKSKFETTINDFMQNRFKDLLYKDYKDIKLYFVSNIEIYKRDIGLKLETLINVRFNYGDRKFMIQPKMPTPNIRNCH
jgi:hypothetical protein